MKVKFPYPKTAALRGWTHQVSYLAFNGNDEAGAPIYVPCFARYTSQDAAELHADRVRQDPHVREVRVDPIPQAIS